MFCVSACCHIVLWYRNHFLINIIVNCQSISCVCCVNCAVVNYMLVYATQSDVIIKTAVNLLCNKTEVTAQMDK